MQCTRISLTSKCAWVALIIATIFGSANGQGYLTVHTACGQTLVLVNGEYYESCPNGYLDKSNNCVPIILPQCPHSYVLVNGFCYLENQIPNNVCPGGYHLANNECYPTQTQPCPLATTTPLAPVESTTLSVPTSKLTTTTPSTTSTPEETTAVAPIPEKTTTTLAPSPEEITTLVSTSEKTTVDTTLTPSPVATTTDIPTTTELEEETTPPTPEPLSRCPPGTIFTEEQCRKVICSQGEYYNGRCLLPACPEGTVWRGKRCQQPGYITTIIKIDNVIINEAHLKPYEMHQENINNVIYHTNAPNEDIFIPTETPKSTTEKTFTTTTTARSTYTTTTSTISMPPPANFTGCCKIVTPRICKNYGHKWICFHHSYKRCDPIVCTRPLIYLKPPQVIHEPPVLIMPPNPPLEACTTPDCDDGTTVDCSGCAHNQRERCSTHCYKYHCPDGRCNFMDLRDYCKIYPGEFGCTKNDGCIWNWCGEIC